jgi:DNA ligase (NAD+)
MTEALGLSTALGDEAAYRQAVAAAAAYYGDGSTALDDDAYDRLVRRIAAYEEAHPDQVAPDSPTGKVAGGAVTGDVSHTVPMLSLDNVFSPEELSAWAAGLERRLGRPVQAWSVEPKLDGLAVAAVTGRDGWSSSSPAVTAPRAKMSRTRSARSSACRTGWPSR